MTRTQIACTSAILLLALAVALVIGACEGLPTKDDIAETRHAIDAAEAAAVDVLDDESASQTDRDEASATIIAMRSKRAALAELERTIDAESGPSQLESTITGIVGGVPGWGPIAAGLVPLLGWGLREWKLRPQAKAYRQLLVGLDVAKKRQPALATALDAATDVLHAVMDRDVQATIRQDRERSKSLSERLGVGRGPTQPAAAAGATA